MEKDSRTTIPDRTVILLRYEEENIFTTLARRLTVHSTGRGMCLFGIRLHSIQRTFSGINSILKRFCR